MLKNNKKIGFLLFAALCLLGLLSCQPENRSDEPKILDNQSVTLYLIRHAEKDTSISENPPLTKKGEQRAAKLAHFFSETKIEAIYSTAYQRTKQTVGPLAEKMKLPIQEYDAKKPIAPFIETLLKAHPNQRIVVVGHSNTIPKMLNVLVGQAQFEDLEDDAYDYVFQVTIDKEGQATIFSYKMDMD
jgi:2,3-bisphosphoglycerate-dependent phosphoglycerate mutase